MENKVISDSTLRTIRCNGKLISTEKPLIMGILNITPDSFYDGGQFITPQKAIIRVDEILQEGADIIDVGAVSTRPGAEMLTAPKEQDRLMPILEIIRKKYPEAIISVDTFNADTALKSVSNFQVDIINDISAGMFDENMFDTIASLNVPYIMMHTKGTPSTMQINPRYENIIEELISYFVPKIEQLKKSGVSDIIIDPGFGFAKTLEHNYELISRLDELNIIDLPILVGISRKSMIYKLLNITPSDALNGTTALHMFALSKGASILRVHDVKEAVEVVNIFQKINSKNLSF